MNYFVIEYLAGERGCPPILKGKISSDWQWDQLDPDPGKFTVTNSYEYHWKAPLVNFDFWSRTLIASGDFVALCQEYGAQIVKVPLVIYQLNNKRTEKNYFYLLWKDWLSILDLNSSIYEYNNDIETGKPRKHKYFPDSLLIESISSFVVDEAKVQGKHVFKCFDLGAEVVCDEEFRQACLKKKLVGLKFSPISEYKLVPFWKR